MGQEHILGVTRAVNWLLGKPAAALFAFLHIQPSNPQYPIPNFFAMELVTFLLAVIFFLWLKPRISADHPPAAQQCMELLITNPMGVGVKDLLDDIVGQGSESHIPLLGTIGIFILLCNLVAVVPGFMSPTAEKTVPLACALVVFFYYNWFGIRKHGAAAYAKTLMAPGESDLAHHGCCRDIQPLCPSAFTYCPSLGQHDGERTALRFVSRPLHRPPHLPGPLNPLGYTSAVVPVGIPFAVTLFHIFEAVLQAFIFTILSVVYLGLAVADEH